MTKKRQPKLCAKCGEREALARLDFVPPVWVCTECLQEMISAPHNVEKMQADEDLNEHLDGGGTLS